MTSSRDQNKINKLSNDMLHIGKEEPKNIQSVTSKPDINIKTLLIGPGHGQGLERECRQQTTF